MYNLYSLQEHCKAKLMLTITTDYICIMIMDLCDMIITLLILLHITICILVGIRQVTSFVFLFNNDPFIFWIIGKEKMYVRTCNSCNTGMKALPEMYSQQLKSIHIS